MIGPGICVSLAERSITKTRLWWWGAFLKWTENPLVKAAEAGLVVLLTLHLLGGIRVLLIENLKWQPGQKQMAIAAIWPKGEVPDDYGEPVRGDMPVLFISGTHDPVTPPRWGAAAVRHFPNGLHLVVPAAHGTGDPKIERFKRAFLNAGSAEGLDTSFVRELRMPPLYLPKTRRLEPQP